MGPEQTGMTGTTYEGHRDVVDISWAICKFFFLFYSSFFGTNIFRYLLLQMTTMQGHHHHHCEHLLARWKDEGDGMMGGRWGKKGTRPHLPQPYEPLLIGWIMSANGDKG